MASISEREKCRQSSAEEFSVVDHLTVKLQFLRDLIEENAAIAGDVLQVSDNLWAIHGYIPVDCDVLMAEFESYDQAASILAQLSPRSRRRDGFLIAASTKPAGYEVREACRRGDSYPNPTRSLDRLAGSQSGLTSLTASSRRSLHAEPARRCARPCASFLRPDSFPIPMAMGA